MYLLLKLTCERRYRERERIIFFRKVRAISDASRLRYDGDHVLRLRARCRRNKIGGMWSEYLAAGALFCGWRKTAETIARDASPTLRSRATFYEIMRPVMWAREYQLRRASVTVCLGEWRVSWIHAKKPVSKLAFWLGTFLDSWNPKS